MSLVKSANVTQATLGDTITFCLQWQNNSQSATVMTLWDTVSSYLTYLGCNTGCSESASLVTWNLGSQSAGSSGTVCFWAKVSGYP
jgi:uncharacterized repeat protein (TIGR01451 family)